MYRIPRRQNRSGQRRYRLLCAAQRKHQSIRQTGWLVALQLGPFKIPWFGKDSHKNDPYWDFFVNTPPADLANTVTEMIRNAPDGSVFPTKAELHTPEITSSHVKGMAGYFGAELVGIAKLDNISLLPPGEGEGEGDHYPFAIICAVHADYD